MAYPDTTKSYTTPARGELVEPSERASSTKMFCAAILKILYNEPTVRTFARSYPSTQPTPRLRRAGCFELQGWAFTAELAEASPRAGRKVCLESLVLSKRSKSKGQGAGREFSQLF